MDNTYQTILNAVKEIDPTFTEKGSGESDQEYLIRLAGVTGNAPDEQWKTLPDEVKQWYNAASTANNDRKPVPVPQGYEPEGEAAAAASADGKAPGKRGIMVRARELTLLNPSITWQQLMVDLAAEGWPKVNEDTVWLCHAEVRNVLKAASNVGLALTKTQVPQQQEAAVA